MRTRREITPNFVATAEDPTRENDDILSHIVYVLAKVGGHETST